MIQSDKTQAGNDYIAQTTSRGLITEEQNHCSWNLVINRMDAIHIKDIISK